MSNDLNSNKAVVRRFHEFFDQGDFDSIATLLTPDVRAYQPGMPGHMEFEEFKQFGMMFHNAFSESQVVFDDQIAEGEKVVSVGVWNAVHTGNFQGIPPTNIRVQVPIVIVDRFADGKIKEHWGYFDAMTMMQQLGVIPSPQQG